LTKVRFPPSVNGKTPQFVQTGSSPFAGTVLSGTWSLAQCPDTTGLLSHHTFTIGTGIDAIYTQIDWGDETQLIYLRLYDPSCAVAGVYGRINAPTSYTGTLETYDKR
jgi:hypothetical protein